MNGTPNAGFVGYCNSLIAMLIVTARDVDTSGGQVRSVYFLAF
jgi:hypothetical protein